LNEISTGTTDTYTHACNQSDAEEKIAIKKFVYLKVIGDGVHNLIDGMIIAASFS